MKSKTDFIKATYPILLTGLIAHPICMLVYWLLLPSYGQLEAQAILKTIAGHTDILSLANAFGLASCILAVPAALAMMITSGDRSPKMVLISGSMVITGWTAFFGVLVLDIVARQIVMAGPPSAEMTELFGYIINDSTIIVLNIIISLHLIGGILLGSVFWSGRLIPRWAALILIIYGPIHVASNISGILIIDSLTWIALLAANTTIIRPLRSFLGASA